MPSWSVSRPSLHSLPQNLLAPIFRGSTTELTDAVRAEMKEAIEAAKNELKDWQAKLEAARAELAKAGSTQNALRAERDKLFQQVAALEGDRSGARERRRPASEDRRGSAARAGAPDQRQAGGHESRHSGSRSLEAKLAREASLADVRELNQHDRRRAHPGLARRCSTRCSSAIVSLAEPQERSLKQAAATQENKARQSDDPLERYRARRLAELLELEARIVKNEQSLAAGTSPALEEQRALADRAESEFAADQAAARRRQRQPARRPPAEQRLPPHRSGARPPPAQRAGHASRRNCNTMKIR